MLKVWIPWHANSTTWDGSPKTRPLYTDHPCIQTTIYILNIHTTHQLQTTTTTPKKEVFQYSLLLQIAQLMKNPMIYRDPSLQPIRHT